jgi:hypothetical protein
MTDDLRARIATALLRRAHIGPETDLDHVLVTGTVDALTDAVMAIVEPAIHQARHYVRGACRYCGGRPNGYAGKRPKPHAMRCQLYVGPLEHRFAGKSETFLGYVDECTCGRSWRDEDGGCPDAALDWRGPKPAVEAAGDGDE